MDEVRKNDDALFEALNKAKRRKRRRRWITVLVILAIVASGILYAVNVLRKRVEASMATEGDEVLTYDASIGSISTRVSGSGTIEDVDTEKVTVPEGVEIDEVMVKSNDKLRKGDLIATLDLTLRLHRHQRRSCPRISWTIHLGRPCRRLRAEPERGLHRLCQGKDGCGGLYGGKRRIGPDFPGRENGGRV